MPKLTKRLIDSLKAGGADLFIWDSDVHGFGVRVKPSGRKSYVLQYRNDRHPSRRSRNLRAGSGSLLAASYSRSASDDVTTAIAKQMDSAHSTQMTCFWCGATFSSRRTGGSPQRFCSRSHRNAYHTAARRYVDRLVAAGELSIATLNASGTACTLRSGALSRESDVSPRQTTDPHPQPLD